MAEERVGRKCGGLRVLNSYWINQVSNCRGAGIGCFPLAALCLHRCRLPRHAFTGSAERCVAPVCVVRCLLAGLDLQVL